MLLSVKLDYNNIKYVTIHNLGNSCETEISNPVMIRGLDPYIKDLTFDSFYENNNSVTIQVSPEIYDKIDEYLSRYGRPSNPQKWIKFNDRDIFFNTLRHFSKVGDQITEKLNLPDDEKCNIMAFIWYSILFLSVFTRLELQPIKSYEGLM